MTEAKVLLPGVTYLPPAVQQYYEDEGVLTTETLPSAFRSACARYPDRIALSEPGITLTFAQVAEQVDRFAAGLLGLGLDPLDRVLFQMTNCKELVIAILGTLSAGLIPICTLASHRASEIGQIGNLAGAKVHVVSPAVGRFDLVEFAKDMRGVIPSLRYTIVVGDSPTAGDFPTFADLIGRNAAARARSIVDGIDLDPFQVALFQLSGGTSGVPKIIPRFHSEYLYSARTVARWHDLNETTVAFTPNPMMHNAPMICYWMPTLLMGGEVAIAPTPDAECLARIVRERRPNWAMIMTVHLGQLAQFGVMAEAPFADARGLAAMADAPKLSATFRAPFYHIYGMTEGLLTYTRAGDPGAALADTVGRALSVYDEIRIVEPRSMRDVPLGSTGELVVRGPCTTRGYYAAAEQNASSFSEDGYYRSGDLMSFQVIEGERFLRFEGRIKDVVDRGGEKINCVEVETAIAAHPGVAGVLCVGMPDLVFGERVCAFIVPTPAVTELTVATVRVHLDRIGLARFKHPERVEVVESFPMTTSGKPSKPLLKERIAEILRIEREGVPA